MKDHFGLNVVAIIPARGGSKGIPRKNIVNLAGKPLIAWSIEQAKAEARAANPTVTQPVDTAVKPAKGKDAAQ